MSDNFFDDFDIIMSKKPNTRPNTTHKDRLHHGIVLGTGMGKGSDDIDLMKIKPEPQPELPLVDDKPLGPQMMWNPTGLDRDTLAELGVVDEESFDKFVESGVYGDEIAMKWPKNVTFNDKGNKTYVYEKPIAAASSKKKEKKGKKKSGGKKKTRKKKTRKKRGGQKIIPGQIWEIEDRARAAPQFVFIRIKGPLIPSDVFPGRWIVQFAANTGGFTDEQEVVMNSKEQITGRYKLIQQRQDEEREESGEQLPQEKWGGKRHKKKTRKKKTRKKKGGTPCPGHDKLITDLNTLEKGKGYIFNSKIDRKEVNWETGEDVSPWISVQPDAQELCSEGFFINLVPKEQDMYGEDTAYFCDFEAPGSNVYLWRVYPAKEHIWKMDLGLGNSMGSGGGRKGKKKPDLKKMKEEMEKVDLGEMTYDEQQQWESFKKDIISPEKKIQNYTDRSINWITARSRYLERKKEVLEKSIGNYGYWLKLDKMWKSINNIHKKANEIGAEELIKFTTECLKRKEEGKFPVKTEMLGGKRWWGSGGGGAASSLRRRIPEGMTIETMTTDEGRVVGHDEVSYSTPIDFNYENEIQELNRRTRQQINEINRIYKDEDGDFKRDLPYINYRREWTNKYNELLNNYNQQKARLDALKEQYQTADVVHENIGVVGAPEAQGGGRKKKTRRRKVKCGSITVKLKYKDRN